ncbi:MAG: hypothetical protein ACQCXQ_15230 [Verrucomicrobiales bacterium]|nr:hypothetical protein [Verrucomicrobiota bacterium JB025]
MKKLVAWALSILSGLYLLIAGPMIDPLPFIDEATALLVFINATAYLGYDMRRWIPFFGKGKTPHQKTAKDRPDVTIDV